jgi:hypothetical protein
MNADRITQALLGAGFKATYDHSGGNVGTIYIATNPGEEIAVGPFEYRSGELAEGAAFIYSRTPQQEREFECHTIEEILDTVRDLHPAKG